ncbi:MAG: hypothetical protein Q8S60_02675 [Parvibaculum sp.]|nr:hypothetical protein [Parvibaculum sp.]
MPMALCRDMMQFSNSREFAVLTPVEERAGPLLADAADTGKPRNIW